MRQMRGTHPTGAEVVALTDTVRKMGEEKISVWQVRRWNGRSGAKQRTAFEGNELRVR